MNDKLTLHQIRMSGNSIKVRIALAYKGLAYEAIDVDPQDRAEIAKLSGQPLTPVLVHGGSVLFDSASILRYLDANFRDSPALYSADYAEMKQIEQWEAWARGPLNEPFYMMLTQLRSGESDPAVGPKASSLLHEVTGRIEERLAGSEWLAGNRMSAADVTAAPYVFYGMLPEQAAAISPMAAALRQALHLGEGRDRTRAWAQRVMAHDR
jgi:glutathione S-transferase